jgi:RHS repeat-associated protein
LTGGIGGLLEMTKDGKRYNYYYDGKGNVSACINADPALANVDGEYAYYAYDTFGSQVSQTGTLEQPYRFSTKYYYAGYGLNDYGFRFYNPMVGKWMTRDPIGERGGLNLYGFVGNSAMNFVDTLGLYSATGDWVAKGAAVVGVAMMGAATIVTAPAWVPTVGLVLVVGGAAYEIYQWGPGLVNTAKEMAHTVKTKLIDKCRANNNNTIRQIDGFSNMTTPINKKYDPAK